MPLTCAYCNKPTTADYINANGKDYHTTCYRDHIELKCVICSEGINGSYLHDEWGNNVCAKHQAKHCDSCNRIITAGGVNAVNARFYCNICSAISVKNSANTATVYQGILNVYNKYGILNVPTHVPVYVVDAATLAGKSLSQPSKDLLGLAATEETVAHFPPSRTYTHHIYILGGLPQPEFESVLAHELLHTWLNQYAVKMSDAETEGFCNLGSYLVLSLKGTKHAKILMKKIQEDPSPTYGGGFRKMLAEVQNKGWAKFLNEIKMRK